jgi:hypothetical protein
MNSFILRQFQEKERKRSVAAGAWAKVGKLSGTGAFKHYDSEILRNKKEVTVVEPGEEEVGATGKSISN